MHLTRDVTFCQPPDLPLANHIHCLISRDGSQCSLDGSEPEAGGHALLDESVILAVPVYIDHARSDPTRSPQRHLHKILRRTASRLRFAAYIEGLAEAAGHAERHAPLKNYCTGLLLPGERKSVEPMAARLAADNVRRMHQSLHHVVADAPWSDGAVLDRCLDFVIPAMLRRGPVVAWVVDDTGFPKKGRESVGVARQYCGQVGKQDNCRVAVSLSVTTEKASMPVAYRLYLPQSWIEDRQRRKKTGVPDSTQFQTKPEISLDQIRRARERGIPPGVVLADAGYGTDSDYRAVLTKLEMTYVVGIQSTTTVWKPGEEPKPTLARKGNSGRPRKLLQGDANSQPVSVKELAISLPAEGWKKVTWRQGVKQKLQSRFAALRVRPAHRDYWRSDPTSGRMVADRMASGGRPSRPNTGYPLFRLISPYWNLCIWPNIAGSSNGITRN